MCVFQHDLQHGRGGMRKEREQLINLVKLPVEKMEVSSTAAALSISSLSVGPLVASSSAGSLCHVVGFET
jgi:hypothetical protein